MKAIIAFANQKGGVGKTTTTVSVAGALGQSGQRVLLIDLDPDAYATIHLAGDDEKGSMADVLLCGRPMSAVIQHTRSLGIDLAPSSVSNPDALAEVNAQLLGKIGAHVMLEKALRPIRDQYDYILIDCPPQVSLLPTMALVAADHLVIPTNPDFFSMSGLGATLARAEEVHEAMEGKGAKMLGLAITNGDYRSTHASGAEAYLRERFGELVFSTVVRVNVALRRAQQAGQTIFDFDPGSAAAHAYAALANEITGRIA